MSNNGTWTNTQWLSAITLVVFCGGAVALLAYQAYLYLRLGYWVGFNVLDLIAFIEPKAAGFMYLRENWAGVYNILQWAPASLSMFATGVSLSALIEN